MPTTCQCPKCSRYLNAPNDALGQEVECPGCGEVFLARPGGTSMPAEADDSEESGEEESSEEETPEEVSAAAGEDFPEHLPGQKQNAVAQWLLAASIMGLVAHGYLSLSYTWLSRTVSYSIYYDAGDMLSQTRRMMIAFWVLNGLYVATAVAVVAWVHRTYKNLVYLNVDEIRHTPGQAVAFLFVPIINLVKSLQIFTELWKTSDPEGPVHNDTAWRQAPVTGLIALWWFLLVGALLCHLPTWIYNFSLNYYYYYLIREDPLLLRILGFVLSLVSTICLFIFVQQVQARQAARYQRLLTEPEEEYEEEFDEDEYDAEEQEECDEDEENEGDSEAESDNSADNQEEEIEKS
jgi:hypothetical protein